MRYLCAQIELFQYNWHIFISWDQNSESYFSNPILESPDEKKINLGVYRHTYEPQD